MLFNTATSPCTLYDATLGGPDAGETFERIGVFADPASTPFNLAVFDSNGKKQSADGREASLLPGTGVGFRCGLRGISKIIATFSSGTLVAACAPSESA